MKDIIISLFGNNQQQEYINVVIAFIEMTITVLSLLTIFFNINYENNVLKLKEIIWEIRNSNNINNLNKDLYDYYTIEKTRLKSYDKMIIFFRIINIAIIVCVLTIFSIKVNNSETMGEIIFLSVITLVVIFTILFIIHIFKTSKENKDIYQYHDLINMDNYEKIFENNINIIPTIKIFISSMNGEIGIKYKYPICCYNINMGICLMEKVYYSHKSLKQSNDFFEKELSVEETIANIEANKFLYSELKDKKIINIRGRVILGNVIEDVLYNATICQSSDGIILETQNYCIETYESEVMHNSMMHDGLKYYN